MIMSYYFYFLHYRDITERLDYFHTFSFGEQLIRHDGHTEIICDLYHVKEKQMQGLNWMRRQKFDDIYYVYDNEINKNSSSYSCIV